MTNTPRQRYGLGSFIKKAVKKIGKGAKKVWKSPLGKAALIGGSLYGLNRFGLGSSGIGKNWWSKALGTGPGRFLMGTGLPKGPAGKGGVSRGILGGAWDWAKANKGKAAMLGLGTAGVLAPFLAKGDDEEEEEVDWSITPSSIANIRNMARNRDASLAFMPPSEYVQSGYYLKDGGIARLANGGQPGNAQAEQMLKMEYQKYRNQGGTMSYQQFKMAVLQQAQSQGPMAQGQRGGYQGGELVEDASMIEETPRGMMEENVEEVQGEPTREQMEALAMEIFQLRLEELDEEQLMIVYQAAMEQQPAEVTMQEEDIQFNPQMAAPQMAAEGGRVGYRSGTAYPHPNRVVPQGDLKSNMLNVFANKLSGRKIATPVSGAPINQGNSFMGSLLPQAFKSQDADYQAYIASGSPLDYQAWKASRQAVANGGIMGTHVPGYTTPPGYNRFDYPSGGVRVGRAEGGLMDLGGMEKDYRAEGGFVPIGGKERADDVPARLSKNEFVFTADAVRNAGGGDIDAGAEVMQNMMENLEAGGQISEESQGGGEEMISEEELIEDPSGAQEMYNQQRMLESRMI